MSEMNGDIREAIKGFDKFINEIYESGIDLEGFVGVAVGAIAMKVAHLRGKGIPGETVKSIVRECNAILRHAVNSAPSKN